MTAEDDAHIVEAREAGERVGYAKALKDAEARLERFASDLESDEHSDSQPSQTFVAVAAMRSAARAVRALESEES